MHYVACCLLCSVRADLAMEAWLWLMLKVRRKSEDVLVSGCHCFLGDPLLVLLPEWREVRHPFGHRLSLQTHLQYLESRKEFHKCFLVTKKILHIFKICLHLEANLYNLPSVGGTSY